MITRSPFPAALGLTAGLAFPSTAQTVNPIKIPFESLWGRTRNAELGSVLASCGDVDGDGIRDLLVSAPGDLGGAAPPPGMVLVLSGRGSTELHRLIGAPGFGRVAAGVGDTDGDGHDDLAIVEGVSILVVSGATGFQRFSFPLLWGSIAISGGHDVNADGFDDLVVGYATAQQPGTSGGNSRGLVQVVSGLDGSLLRELYAEDVPVVGLGYFGRAVALLPDVNGDGRADFAVGSPADSASSYFAGSTRVFSGLDGSELFAVFGASLGSLGWSLAVAGDLDGDGVSDLLVGAPWEAVNLKRPGVVRAISGASGQVIHFVEGTVDGGEFWLALARGADSDGDDVPDILIGAKNLARLVSGRDGSLLAKYNKMKEDFGAAVALVADLNGDGRADPAVGVPRADASDFDEGRVDFFLGACDLADAYCTAGTSTSGCTATLDSFGAPSASAPGWFFVTATGLDGSSRAVLLHGNNGRSAHPFAGGFLCLLPPIAQAALALSGGTSGACDGTAVFSLDLDRGGVGVAAGERIQLQALFLDAVSSRPVTSAALELTICP